MRYSKVDLAYCAGIIDGEGSIYLGKRVPGRRRKSFYYEATVAVTMTNRAALKLLSKVFGGKVRTAKAVTVVHKKIYGWRRYAQNAENAIKRLLPYLHVKKRQAKLALKFREHIKRKAKNFKNGQTLQGKTLSKADLRVREAFYIQSRKLNKRGPI